MGYATALDLSEQDISLEQQISIHLTSNHYPPVPSSMIQPCIQAIDFANEGDYDALIELPDGVTWRGNTMSPAWAIIEGHHLGPWVTDEEM